VCRRSRELDKIQKLYKKLPRWILPPEEDPTFQLSWLSSLASCGHGNAMMFVFDGTHPLVAIALALQRPLPDSRKIGACECSESYGSE
jgi:hypothetical protein